MRFDLAWPACKCVPRWPATGYKGKLVSYVKNPKVIYVCFLGVDGPDLMFYLLGTVASRPSPRPLLLLLPILRTRRAAPRARRHKLQLPPSFNCQYRSLQHSTHNQLFTDFIPTRDCCDTVNHQHQQGSKNRAQQIAVVITTITPLPPCSAFLELARTSSRARLEECSVVIATPGG